MNERFKMTTDSHIKRRATAEIVLTLLLAKFPDGY
jgi:hypothetical protein